MSKYTTEVRFICETANGLNESAGYSKVDEIISGAIPKVFDFPFPIFDESYRNVLCAKILKHYYTREIGDETVGLWKLRLNTRMNEIMPYYNKLYKSELINFNPLYDTDLTKTGNREHDGNENTNNTQERITDNDGSYIENGTKGVTANANNTTEQTTHSTETNNNIKRDKYSDTPQGALTNVENDTYLTNARKVTDDETKTADSSGTSNNTTSYTENDTDSKTGTTKNKETITDEFDSLKQIKTTDDYLEHITGKSSGVSYSKMLMEFRDTFLNIDMMVINALADLFFNLW